MRQAHAAVQRRRALLGLSASAVSITLDTHLHAIPAMEKAAALIAELVFSTREATA